MRAHNPNGRNIEWPSIGSVTGTSERETSVLCRCCCRRLNSQLKQYEIFTFTIQKPIGKHIIALSCAFALAHVCMYRQTVRTLTASEHTKSYVPCGTVKHRRVCVRTLVCVVCVYARCSFTLDFCVCASPCSSVLNENGSLCTISSRTDKKFCMCFSLSSSSSSSLSSFACIFPYWIEKAVNRLRHTERSVCMFGS